MPAQSAQTLWQRPAGAPSRSVERQGLIARLPLGEVFVLAILLLGAKTTLASTAPVEALAFSLMGIAALLGAQAFGQGIKYTALALALYLFGIAVSSLTSLEIWPPYNVASMLAVSAAGALIASSREQFFSSQNSAWAIIAIVGAYLAITLWSGGLVMDGLPRYQFEVFDENGFQQYTAYSQGISKLMGVAAIPCIYYALHSDKIQLRFIFTITGLFSISQSFLGGARGEFIGLALVVLMMILKKNQRLLFAVGMGTFFLLTILPVGNYGELVLIDRLIALWQDDTLGGRQQLFADAVTILQDKPYCLLAGCGFQYFQAFWDFPFSAYPHNYILDFLISIGLPLTALIYTIYAKSTLRFMNQPANVPCAYIMVYLFIISMKSGSPQTDHLFWIFFARQIWSLRKERAA